MCNSPQPPPHPHIWFFRLVYFPIFLDQWRSVTSNRFVLNMVQGHHLQLRSCPPLFCYFWQFNVKVAAALHPIIHEVDELLSKGAIEPYSGFAGCYPSVFVIPEHTGGLPPILNLKQCNHYLHIPSFKMPTLGHVQHLQDADLHIPIVKHHHFFLWFVWHNIPYQWKVLPFGLNTAPRVLAVLTKPVLFLCHCKGYILLSIWMTSWSWFALSGHVRGLTHFVFFIGLPWIAY